MSSEAGCRRQAGEQQRSPKVIKLQPVELSGVRGQTPNRPKETLGLREPRESAEAIVARKFGESRTERRAEE